MPVLEQACGKECAPSQPLGSTKQGHCAQSAAPVTPFGTVNQVQDAYGMLAGILLCVLGSGCVIFCGCSTRACAFCQI